MALGSTLSIDARRARKSTRPVSAFLPRKRMTPRLLQVKQLLATGMSNKEISARLGLALGTVKIYASQVYGLMGMGRRDLIVAEARNTSGSGCGSEGELRIGAFE